MPMAFLQKLRFNRLLQDAKWQLFEKVMRMGTNLVVGLWFANYLGVGQFGIWSYALVLSTFVNTLLMMGMPQLITKELAAHPEKVDKVLFTLTSFRVGLSVLFLLATVGTVSVMDLAPVERWLILIFAVSWLFTAFEFFQNYFISISRSKITALVQVPVFLAANLLKIVFMLQAAPLFWFAWVYVFELGLPFLLMFCLFLKQRSNVRFQFDVEVFRNLFATSWPLILSAVAVYAYMRFDQIMIKYMADEQQLGLYSLAVKLVEPLYFISTSLVTSALPLLSKAYEQKRVLFQEKLTDLYRLLTWLSLAVIAVTWLLIDPLLALFLSVSYAPAGMIVKIYVLSFLATSWGVATTQFLLIKGLTKVSFFRTSVGLLLNLVLNYFWIPLYQAEGAAWATVTSYFVATLSMAVSSNVREQVFYLFASFNPFALLTSLRRHLK